MHNKFSNCFVWVSPSTSDLKFHGHICRYVSKYHYNIKGSGRYSVNTLHIPCSPPFSHKVLIYKILIFHEM